MSMTRSFLLLLLALSTILSGPLAVAQSVRIGVGIGYPYHPPPRYYYDEPIYRDYRASTYTRVDVSRCENQGQNTALGIFTGGLVGLLAGRGRITPALPIGMAVGGILGASLSCRQRVTYITHVDRCLHRARLSSACDDANVRVRIIREGRNSRGEFCRVYQATYYDGSTPVRERSSACHVNGHYRFGFHESAVVSDAGRQLPTDHGHTSAGFAAQ